MRGEVMSPHLIGSFRRRTPNLTIKNIVAANPAEIPGAMMKPAKMVASLSAKRQRRRTEERMESSHPFPLFHPQLTLRDPPSATPTPATAETIEYVVETGQLIRVAVVSQRDETMTEKV